MNKIIMKLAISKVKGMVCPVDNKCEICRKNITERKQNEIIKIKGMPTEIGILVCGNCFDNIQIAIGEISEEY
ncbi:MAG: hypothetical protein HN737_11365 [Desulfobacterales bacterium]|jgi:hypothetical protein|nr:hypothetical protein [Desulfobacteraceae bacterium]MBT4365499.1 hypothetical protein [Desulfobacteraceae bacterium]MBT7085952.1 hypothetical protein [Desulfobacterales bacterium]MBT7697994.1 hypothetical protein [Desulfobacterales bacterium]